MMGTLILMEELFKKKNIFFFLTTVLLCTESFTKEECIILQSLLEKLNIKSTLKIRDKINNKYRIRISKTSMDRVILLVKPYMHNDFLYKLGI